MLIVKGSYIKENKYKSYFMADSGYCSKKITRTKGPVEQDIKRKSADVP